jgi:hypothetical protein
MSTFSLTLDEIFDLAKKTLLANGCDDETASILSDLLEMLNEMGLYHMVYLDYQHM